MRWAERTGLFGAGPSDRIYTTWIDDEQKMHVRFGDGRFGARLPTGRANVVATYRQGLGEVGNVPAGRIITALDKPAGVASGVSNPFPATGGVDPERRMERGRTLPTRCEPSIGQCRCGTSPTWHVSSPVSRRPLPPGFGTGGAGRSSHRRWRGWRRPLRRPTDGFAQLPRPATRSEPGAPYSASSDPCRSRSSVSVEADPDHFNEDVQAEVTAQVTDYFAYDNRDFGQAVHLSDVYEVVHRAARRRIGSHHSTALQAPHRPGQPRRAVRRRPGARSDPGCHAPIRARERRCRRDCHAREPSRPRRSPSPEAWSR